MNYKEVYLQFEPLEPARDIATAYLAEGGYEMFQEEKDGLKAYVPVAQWDQAFLDETLASLAFAKVKYAVKEIEDQNWNAAWESQFDPIDVDGRCYIRAPFHEAKPGFEYDVLISPQMSFGTGHHATTFQMVKAMLDLDFSDKVVLDMGCGTGILAVLAEKQGAKTCLAIDIEQWAYENALENIALNACSHTEAKLGDAALLPTKATFDVVLANINRNILIQDMERYVSCMRPNAYILFSGFFPTDNAIVAEKAHQLGLSDHREQQFDGWSQLTFQKKG